MTPWPTRHPLALLPTALHPMDRLSAVLGGPRLWIKRDDQTGLGMGGNKTRKLEFLLGAALDAGADALITAGAAQSNHCRQTTAAAASVGLECHLVLGGQEPERFTGNLLLDKLFGAHIHWAGAERKGESIHALAKTLRGAGKTPAVIPYGGSNAVGALGYVAAMEELASQLHAAQCAPQAIVFASSSGGTHAGMLVGASTHGIDANIIGVHIDKADADALGTHIDALCAELAAYTGPAAGPHRVVLDERMLKAAYGELTEAEHEAIALLARTEGILLDPVYTGRAMAGLISMVRGGEFEANQDVLFWHTGGTPALFHYGDTLL